MRFHVRLLLILLLGNVLLRFFTNYLGLLPRHFNLLDVAVTILLSWVAIVQPANGPRNPLRRSVFRGLLAIFGIGFLGWFLNDYPVHTPAAVAQIVMLAEPFALFLAISRLGLGEKDIGRFVTCLEFLIKLQLLIGIFQVPIFFATGESESIMGTFQHNAEQYAAFITLGIFYTIGKIRVEDTCNKFRWAMVIAMLILVLLIDNKASWLGLLVSLLAVLLTLGTLTRRLVGLIAATTIGLALVTVGLLVVLNVSGSLHKFERLAKIWREGDMDKLGKVKAIRDVAYSHNETPHMWLVGSGPGSFYSRASRQFYGLNPAEMYTEVLPPDRAQREYAESDSMGGVLTQARKRPYYSSIQRHGDQIVPVGSGQVDEPFSFYNGLLGEFGFVGFALYFSAYLTLYRSLKKLLQNHPADRRIIPLATATLGFLVYLVVNSVYGPHLDTGRMTTILWSLAACCLAYSRPPSEQAFSGVYSEQSTPSTERLMQ